jgi:hypothetical protein
VTTQAMFGFALWAASLPPGGLTIDSIRLRYGCSRASAYRYQRAFLLARRQALAP